MPKLMRWLRVHKEFPIFPPELAKKLSEMNVTLAGGSHTVTQNLHVNSHNKEETVRLLEEHGYTIEEVEQG